MYDIFLAGPWEQYSPVPYKSLLKAALPELSFYDPEEHQSSNWFDLNRQALRKSNILFVFIPNFPFPGVGPEVGIYFEHKVLMGRKPQIIAVWPNDVQPQWGKEVLSRMGAVVSTIDEALMVIWSFLETKHDTPGNIDGIGV